jgi:hypothetical protein
LVCPSFMPVSSKKYGLYVFLTILATIKPPSSTMATTKRSAPPSGAPADKAEKEKSVNELMADLFDDTIEQAKTILTDSRYSLHRATVINHLTRLKYRFHSVGSGNGKPTRTQFGPIVPRKAEDSEVKAPSVIAGEELAQEVNAIYDGFSERENDELLDSLTDLQIRGVAKKAGLEVTQTKPEHITSAYIDQIKAAIVKKAAAILVSSNPGGALQKELADTEAQIDQVTTEKEAIIKAINVESDAAKKEKLQKQLVELTTTEGELYLKLDQINSALQENGNKDQ